MNDYVRQHNRITIVQLTMYIYRLTREKSLIISKTPTKFERHFSQAMYLYHLELLIPKSQNWNHRVQSPNTHR